MKKFLGILALMIAVTAIKAVAWVSQNGAPPTLAPQTTGDMIGIAFVGLLVVTFVGCSIWYLVKGDKDS